MSEVKYFFDLEVKDYPLINYFFNVCSFIDSATIEITKEGIHLSGYDPTRISFVHFHLNAADLDKYDFKKGKITSFYVSPFAGYKRLLRGRTFGWKMTNNQNKFYFRKESLISYFDEKISFASELMKKDTTKGYEKEGFETGLNIPYTIFKTVLEDINLLFDHFSISSTPMGVYFFLSKDFKDKEVYYHSQLSNIYVTYIKEEEVVGTYSLDFFLEIMKIFPEKKGEISLEYSSGKPLKFEATLRSKSFIKFMLAPRIEAEDD